ncbi:MAG TPA: hypothetical protein VG476_03775, partial [Acidimicrobiales bacterium]|nr:hypothetical protein [Acidimicrobiales bacterium]
MSAVAILQVAAAAGWLGLHSASGPVQGTGVRTGHTRALGTAALPAVTAPTTTPPPPTPAALQLQSQVTAAMGGTPG